MSALDKVVSIKNFYKVNPIRKAWLKQIIDTDYRNKDQPPDSYSFPINNESIFFKDLYTKFMTVTREIFGDYNLDIGSVRNSVWCYRSALNDCNCVWHDHIRTCTINGVYYLQINKGDTISLNKESKEKNNFSKKIPDNSDIIEKYKLEESELLIMPNYLMHKPDPPTGNKVRYCLNMEIRTKETVNELFDRLN